MTSINREQWLNEAANLILDEIIMPSCEALALDVERPPFRVAVGFPVGTRANTKYKTIGQCFPRSMSTGGRNEIFIHPELDSLDSVRILDILTHELIHAVDDCETGHEQGKRFAKIARACDLQGKLTSTTAGEELAAHLNEFVELLGNIPHDSIDYSQQPKQKARNLKVVCSVEDCGWTFRASNKQLQRMTSFECLCCGNDSLEFVEG